MATIPTAGIQLRATECSYSEAELSELAEEVNRAYRENLNSHFKAARLQSGRNYWILEDSHGVWLAQTAYDVGKQLRDADIEYHAAMLSELLEAYLYNFQLDGLTVKIPGAVARSIDNPLFVPVYVDFPDGWDTGQFYTLQRFSELIWRYELTPAEALDYWAVKRMDTDTHRWAGRRDVGAEAIRKNIRQAEEKLSDDDLGATHPNGTIEAVLLDEVPDDGDPHDSDADRFYVPRRDAVTEELESPPELRSTE